MHGMQELFHVNNRKLRPRQLLLHCSTTVHAWAYAFSVNSIKGVAENNGFFSIGAG